MEYNVIQATPLEKIGNEVTFVLYGVIKYWKAMPWLENETNKAEIIHVIKGKEKCVVFHELTIKILNKHHFSLIVISGISRKWLNNAIGYIYYWLIGVIDP